MLSIALACTAFATSPALRGAAPALPRRAVITPRMDGVPLLDGLNCGSMTSRLVTSAEVTASKIFPAGAGWQCAAIIAENSGFAPTSLAFFASVGLGDCSGVFLGHLVYQVTVLAAALHGHAKYHNHVPHLCSLVPSPRGRLTAALALAAPARPLTLS